MEKKNREPKRLRTNNFVAANTDNVRKSKQLPLDNATYKLGVRVRNRADRSLRLSQNGANDNPALTTDLLVALGGELPARTSYAQAIIFTLIVQAHADQRDIRVSDLPALAGVSRNGAPVLGDGIRHTYQMFLAATAKVPDGLGWVSLDPDPRDRRSKMLRLTEAGMAVAERVMGKNVVATATAAVAPAPAKPVIVPVSPPSPEPRLRPRPAPITLDFESCGGSHLFGGDCLDILPTLPDQSVDAVIADPPYGLTELKWDKVIPFGPLWAELRRVLKPNGAVIMTAAQPFTAHVVLSNEEWFKYSWVWEKSKPTCHVHAKRMPMRSHEDIIVFSEGVMAGEHRSGNQMPYNPQGLIELSEPKVRENKSRKETIYRLKPGKQSVQTHTNYPRSVIRFPSERNVDHPTQKPLELMRYLVRTYSDPGEVILDFCMGAGSTGVAAKIEGRRFIGIERDSDYLDAARRRIGGGPLAA